MMSQGLIKIQQQQNRYRYSSHFKPFFTRSWKKMGNLSTLTEIEKVRNARIQENQARLAELGLMKTVDRSITSAAKPQKRKRRKIDYAAAPLRRSSRLKGKNSVEKGFLRDDYEDDEKRHANAPLLTETKDAPLSLEALGRRCNSRGRGTLYDPTYGISCHFCRQKKLCGEEDCRRCGKLELDQPCLGKSDCSVCHSKTGVYCRACLKVRYGEEMEDVRANENWMCPHCVEEKGTKPYWICNSSICLKQRDIEPLGIAIFKARKMGFESVAHFLMDRLQNADKARK